MFQHTAARRRLVSVWVPGPPPLYMFQHTAARRRLGGHGNSECCTHLVSTHSRPKAAGPERGGG